MSAVRVRSIAFGVGMLALLLVLVASFRGLRDVGASSGGYAQLLGQRAEVERHASDVVSAINFDYRAFDTLGEESILFASVAGVALLLRPSRRQEETREQHDELEHLPGRQRVPTSDAVRLLALAMVAFDVIFGLDIVLHGQVTPGGGFQGGVILASAPLLAYLGGDAPTLRKIAPRTMVEVAEACGLGAFVVIGLAGIVRGKAFLSNAVPLGPASPGILSGGIIAFISLASGVAVAAGFVLMLLVFLEESLHRTSKGGRP